MGESGVLDEFGGDYNAAVRYWWPKYVGSAYERDV